MAVRHAGTELTAELPGACSTSSIVSPGSARPCSDLFETEKRVLTLGRIYRGWLCRRLVSGFASAR
jgi:hypothetical protein